MNMSAIFKPKSQPVKYAVNLALLQGVFWAAWAFTNYSGYYLQVNGFTASQIGILNAICSVSAIIASILFGYISDKIHSVKKMMILTLTVSAVMYGLIPLLPCDKAYSVSLIIMYFAIMHIFRSVPPTLLDNLSVRTCIIFGINFGLIRCFGSIFFAVVIALSQKIVDVVGSDITFPLFSATVFLSIIILLFSYNPNESANEHSTKERLSFKPLFKNYYYVTFLIFISFYALICDGYLSYFLEDRGIGLSHYGGIIAIRAITEVPALLIMKRLRRRIKLKYIIIGAMVLMLTNYLGIGFIGYSVESVMIFGALLGFGSGLYIGSISQYVTKLAPNNLKTSAQTVYTSFSAAANIIGYITGGFVYDAIGGNLYIIYGFMIFTAVLFFAITSSRRNLENPADELN